MKAISVMRKIFYIFIRHARLLLQLIWSILC